MDECASAIGAAPIHQARLHCSFRTRGLERRPSSELIPLIHPLPPPHGSRRPGPPHALLRSVCAALFSAAVADVRTLFWMIGKREESRKVTGTHMVREGDSPPRPGWTFFSFLQIFTALKLRVADKTKKTLLGRIDSIFFYSSY